MGRLSCHLPLLLMLSVLAAGCGWFRRGSLPDQPAAEAVSSVPAERPTLFERLEGAALTNAETTSTGTADTRFANPERLGDGARAGVGRTFDPLVFEEGRTDLSPPNRRRLDEYAAWLAVHPRVWVTLAGHSAADNSVPWAYHEGMARAIAVREYFVAGGLDARRFYPISYGLDRPSAPAAVQPLDNRVELIAFVAPEGIELPPLENSAPDSAPGSESPAAAPRAEELP